MCAFVYILKSITGRYYVGSTSDLDRRMIQHRNGHTQTTRNMNGFNLVFKQEYATLEEARFVEKKIKKFKRKDFIEKIISNKIITIKY